ncbi:DUF547 domain-containing protein [Halogeometricum limi]|uniref:DUF547 domain-containing protein n=1 Tax=Halogeometricum limi TaxID=555875 RepID=A0A1I6GQZ9_9EURY|nr:DUF547 domain-containing protein [Halogeometricum limi]SFR44652.1 Protein of unknown function, DUF547 [Halogeometricum limi]
MYAPSFSSPSVDPASLSARYLLAVRTGDGAAATDARERLSAIDPATLSRCLPDDAHRTAFWLNVYNAVVQERLTERPEAFDRRTRFFRRDQVPVAGRLLSLDDVEHGILRRSMLSWGLGDLPRPFPDGFERANRVDERDFRVHFALNCGAASCPPIAVYGPETIDRDLDWATEGYLRSAVDYDAGAGVARVPRLFLWYRGDFGGGAGIREILRRYDRVPEDASPKLRYHGYDWSLSLGEYATDRRGGDSDSPESSD